jgi:hypothetical protein
MIKRVVITSACSHANALPPALPNENLSGRAETAIWRLIGSNRDCAARARCSGGRILRIFAIVPSRTVPCSSMRRDPSSFTSRRRSSSGPAFRIEPYPVHKPDPPRLRVAVTALAVTTAGSGRSRARAGGLSGRREPVPWPRLANVVRGPWWTLRTTVPPACLLRYLQALRRMARIPASPAPGVSMPSA